MPTRRTLLKAGCAGVTTLTFPNIVRAKEKPILIGEITTYSPEMEPFTTPYRKGWIMASEAINQAGGIKGRELKIISENDRGQIDTAVAAAEYLIEDRKIDLLCGSALSHLGLALSKVANQYKIPFIASEPLSNKITMEEGNPYTFRLRPSTYMQTQLLAKAAAKLPVNRWACIAPDYEYGRSAVADFKRFLGTFRPDIDWIMDIWHPLFNIDAAKVVETLQQRDIEGVFNASFAADLYKLTATVERTNAFADKSVVSLLSGEPEYLRKLKSPAANGWFVTGYPWEQIKTPTHEKFATTYQKRFHEDPALGSLVGYVMIEAIKALFLKAPDYEHETLRANLENLYFPSPIGMMHFRAADNQASMGAFIGRLHYNDGENEMIDWQYADGSEIWPSVNEVQMKRKDL